MFHNLIVCGYLGKDPEMRFMPDGKPVTSFSVASSRRYTGGNGEIMEETIWFRVSVFGGQAETCNQYLRKGRPVLVQGRLRPDKKTGGPRVWRRQDDTISASFEVQADVVRFLGKGDHDGAEDDPAAGSGAGADSIPF